MSQKEYFKDSIHELIPKLKSTLSDPWLIFLEGDLGVGKTTWTQEFVQALGGEAETVKSPTFLKLLTYEIPNRGTLLHLDAYRIEDIEEFLKMGMESYGNVFCVVVEWPEIFIEFLKTYPDHAKLMGLKKYLKLTFEIQKNTSSRSLQEEWLEFKNL